MKCLNNAEHTNAMDDSDVMPLVPKNNVSAKQTNMYFSETNGCRGNNQMSMTVKILVFLNVYPVRQI